MRRTCTRFRKKRLVVGAPTRWVSHNDDQREKEDFSKRSSNFGVERISREPVLSNAGSRLENE